MKYTKIKNLPEEKFRRETGIKKKTFSLMIKILKKEEDKKKKTGGRPNKLSIENRLLMTLEYLREYRTYFHISNSYSIDESVCYRNIVKIENILIKSKKFSLPKRKELILNKDQIEVIIVDATESPIERPKKKDKKP